MPLPETGFLRPLGKIMPITTVRAEPIVRQIQPDLAIVSSLGPHLVGNYMLVRIAAEAGREGRSQTASALIRRLARSELPADAPPRQTLPEVLQRGKHDWLGPAGDHRSSS